MSGETRMEAVPRGRLLNVSVRLPQTVRVASDGTVKFTRSSGGLATGMESARDARQQLWIGWPGVSAERLGDHVDVVNRRLADDHMRAVHIREDQESGFYASVANGVIWPVLHGQLERLPLHVRKWSDYVAVNQAFADAVVEEWQDGDAIWVHDYQLMLVPRMIRDRLPNALVGFFLHVPFPAPEIFDVIPERRALLEGLLGADVIGVHTHGYQRNLMSTMRMLLGLRPGVDTVTYLGRDVTLGVFPMGVDADRFARLCTRPPVHALTRQLRENGPERTLLGVDRLDYTKGIPRRLLSFERLLERFPEWQGRVRMLQVAVPSRTQVSAYARYREQVDGLVGRINGAFASASWTPVQYLYRSISMEELVAYYRAADVMVVTPLRDGMNLVAKEFAAARDDGDGVLVLSEFTGAADELVGAVRVNPYDIDGTADALHAALTMPEDERKSRMHDLRVRVQSQTVQVWRKSFLETLENVKREHEEQVSVLPVAPEIIDVIVARERISLLLDYDGTLVPIRTRPEQAVPDGELLTLLRDLASADGVEVHVVSGRRYQDLDEWFGSLPITLHAEHGLWTRDAQMEQWHRAITLADDWKESVRAVLERFTARTPGSFIEPKTAGFAWHYRQARPGIGEWQANELRAHLVELLAETPVQVLEGKAVLEVRQEGIHKGLLAARVAAADPDALVVAIGDDRTDDDMFAALPPEGISIAVGDVPRRALYRVNAHTDAIHILQEIKRRRRLPRSGAVVTPTTTPRPRSEARSTSP